MFTFGKTFLGSNVIGDIANGPFPDSGAVGEIPGDGFSADPADFTVNNDSRFPQKWRFLGKGFGIELHPGIVVIGVDTGKGLERIGGGHFPFQACYF